MEHLIDEDTWLIEDDLPTVLEQLSTNYRKVPSEEVKEKYSEETDISFNPADLMLSLFHPIEHLQKLATGAGILYSQAQILQFGLTLIQSTRDFEKGISDWNSKSDTDKTWPNFKKYFKDAQTELK